MQPTTAVEDTRAPLGVDVSDDAQAHIDAGLARGLSAEALIAATQGRLPTGPLTYAPLFADGDPTVSPPLTPADAASRGERARVSQCCPLKGCRCSDHSERAPEHSTEDPGALLACPSPFAVPMYENERPVAMHRGILVPDACIKRPRCRFR